MCPAPGVLSERSVNLLILDRYPARTPTQWTRERSAWTSDSRAPQLRSGCCQVHETSPAFSLRTPCRVHERFPAVSVRNPHQAYECSPAVSVWNPIANSLRPIGFTPTRRVPHTAPTERVPLETAVLLLTRLRLSYGQRIMITTRNWQFETSVSG
jgi:hypothetical protein